MLIEVAKLFRIIETLVDEAYDKSTKINAKFDAIAISAFSTLNDDNQEYKTRVLQNLVKFAQLFINFLRQTLKVKHFIRNNVHRINRHMYDAYNDVSIKIYRNRFLVFYDNLSTMND